MSADTNATKATETPPALVAARSSAVVRHHGLTHLDLFSGIGGFALAAQAAGFTTIGFSEIEPYACKILKRHWPDVPNYGDIRNITRKVLADAASRKSRESQAGHRREDSSRGSEETRPAENLVDLITGGFPCQPFSVAGKRKGANDDRAIWPEMCRVIAEARPRWVLGENVPGIISMELDGVLADLESLGYACWPLVIPACAVDARHRRDRVWIVAHSERSDGRHGSTERNGTSGAGARHEPTRPGQDVADDGCRCGERPGREIGGNAQPAQWQPEPGMGRVADGIPHRSHRLRGLGNAIVPQVALEILKALVTANNQAER